MIEPISSPGPENPVYMVNAASLEIKLKDSRREPVEIGYKDSQEVFILATDPKIEPLSKDEVLELLNDFYKDATSYTELDIRKMKERLLAKGLNNG